MYSVLGLSSFSPCGLKSIETAPSLLNSHVCSAYFTWPRVACPGFSS